MNNDFLPSDYKDIPNKGGSYMKLADGPNRLRVLSSAIVGWEGWKVQADGSNKPVRRRMTETISVNDVDDESRIKHFWSFVVYNYQEEKIQILNITQKGIQKAIKALTSDKDWGSPKDYDLVITRSGQKLETEYQVTPKPAKKLDEGVAKAYSDMSINLEALFENGDPFAEEKATNGDIYAQAN